MKGYAQQAADGPVEPVLDEREIAKLVENYVPLVIKQADRVWLSPRIGLTRDDLVSAGCYGLLLAARRFDPSRGVGFGVSVLGAADLERTIAVGAHQARWRRWTASLELARRWARGDFAIDPHAGLTLGWIGTEGVDYTQNLTASTVSLGGTAGLRVARWVSRRAALWIDLRGFYFPRRDFIYGDNAGGTADQTPVPSWGAIASLGLALGRPPHSR